MAQKKLTVNLTKSDSSNRVSPTLTKIYKGTFVQKFSVLTADSAYIYADKNAFDAFGHVVITQGDTLHIYADNLNYDDNTKVALLTNNVRMVDKDATLTTNWLNYNTQTKVGTYINNGKIVSKDGKNTLTSQNGYYYANTRDVFFRYNVVSTSPDALINTDTMRYNSGTRITYFYGPTHIYGKKDKDTLYTENGTYNTKTEQAFFGKKNRYSQGTKSLKGDSLFYDKLKGYGKAIKNITFEDTEQRTILKGDLGEYFKKDDKAVITQNPYVIFVSEEKDTTKKAVAITRQPTKSTADDLASGINNITKLAGVGGVKLPDTSMIPKGVTKAKADSLAKEIAKHPAVKNTMPLVNGMAPKGATIAKADSLAKELAKHPLVKNAMPLGTNKLADSLKKVAGKLGVNIPNEKMPQVAKSAPVKTTTAKTAQPKPIVSKTTGYPVPIKPGTKIVYTGADTPTIAKPVLALNDSASRIKRDTMYIGADTLETQVVTYKFLKDLQEQRRLAGIRDTSVKLRKPFVPYTLKTIPKVLEASAPKIPEERPTYVDRQLPYLPKPKVDSAAILTALKVKAQKAAKDSIAKKIDVKADVKGAKGLPVLTNSKSDSLKVKNKADSIKAAKPALSDTSRVRILSAHHNVHIFKSDLQGKSDSLFYSSADSVIRSFVKPMYWTQGSQLSGDTILLQLKNKKADNMDVFPKGFVVQIEKKDSTHFNQMAGKRIRAWFKDSKISRVNVNGNAETIYFARKEKTDEVDKMQRSLSSSINISFKNGQMAVMSFVLKADNKMTPIKDVKEDDKLLKNFIWKPEDRPASKEDVIHPKKKAVQPPAKAQTAKDSTLKGAADLKNLKTAKDSSAAKASTILKPKAPIKGGSPTSKPPVVSKTTAPAKIDSSAKAKADSLKKPLDLKLKKDTSGKKADTVKKL